MASFMSGFLANHEEMSEEATEREQFEFGSACKLLIEAEGKDALKRNKVINAARADSILTGLTLAIRANPDISAGTVSSALRKLEHDEDFLESTQKSTSHRTSVRKRLDSALRAFSE
ncbi:hypothetical protein ACWGUN_01685 [Streptomyces koyangensis]